MASDHPGRQCPSSKVCNINGCKRNHHHLLHDIPPTKPSEEVQSTLTPASPGEGVDPDKHNHTSLNKERKTDKFSLRTVPVWLKSGQSKFKVNEILDDASNETFLNQEVAGVLGLNEPFGTVRVHVLNNEVETFQSMPLKLTIESIDGQFRKEINVKTCPKNVTGSYKVEDWSRNKETWSHLRNCDFAQPATDGLVDLLIGVDNADLHYSRADIRGEPGAPVARLGPLGWTCIGAVAATESRSHVIRTLFTRDSSKGLNHDVCCDVDQTIKRFWEVEACGTEANDTRIYTEEENEALARVKDSLSYDATTNRYTVGVPWKPNRSQLPDNRKQATSRLCNTEKKLAKNEYLRSEYQKTIEGYIQKGYLRRVTEDEAVQD